MRSKSHSIPNENVNEDGITRNDRWKTTKNCITMYQYQYK